jgi:hypothetical protein
MWEQPEYAATNAQIFTLQRHRHALTEKLARLVYHQHVLGLVMPLSYHGEATCHTARYSKAGSEGLEKPSLRIAWLNFLIKTRTRYESCTCT